MAIVSIFERDDEQLTARVSAVEQDRAMYAAIVSRRRDVRPVADRPSLNPALAAAAVWKMCLYGLARAIPPYFHQRSPALQAVYLRWIRLDSVRGSLTQRGQRATP